MLNVEIRVNSILIGHLCIVNVTDCLEIGRPATYNYEIYSPTKEIIKGIIKHNRADGAFTLINKILIKESKALKID